MSRSCCALCSPAWSTAIRERAGCAVALLELDLPVVPDEIPRIHFHDAQQLIEAATGRAGGRRARPRPRPRAMARRMGGRRARLGLPVRRGVPDGEAPVLHRIPIATGPSSRTASTCCSAVSSWSPAANGCIATTTTSPRWTTRRALRCDGYLQAFRYGMPPHGGFAIGLERWTARVVGARNIREVTLFPRDINRLSP